MIVAIDYGKGHKCLVLQSFPLSLSVMRMTSKLLLMMCFVVVVVVVDGNLVEGRQTAKLE